MTDRHKGFWVALTDDVREDDIQGLLDAVRRLKGVADARTVPDQTTVTPSDWMNRTQLRHQTLMAANEAMYEAIMGEPHPLAKGRRKP